MEQIPSWQANQLSDNQVIPRILWTAEVRYRIHKCPLTAPSPGQKKNPLHASLSDFLKIHSNIILPSTKIYINTDK
jgi:hypothetical protein